MTRTVDEPTTLLGPQPLGVFDLPAGLMLVPGDDPADAAVRAELVAGRRPTSWPASLAGHRAVHEAAGPLVPHLLFPGDDGISRYHRWLLDPGCATLAEVRAGLPPSYAVLADVVAFSIGLTDAADLPAVDADLPGELAALLLASRATVLLATDPPGAVDLLHEAVERSAEAAPVLSAVLRANAGTLLHEHGLDYRAAREDLATAVVALAGTDLVVARAEMFHQLGVMAHEAAATDGTPLRQAMGHYYSALQLVTESSAPHLWASVQLDLATAHLASPMAGASDQLRLGVAAQALRACRRVFRPETHPGPWSTATLNLANALVYLPSTHQGDNLVEAVELYEEVLTSGVREHDHTGRARVLANQGNALAHLGIFNQARAKLVEARFLFEEHLDHDSAMAVRSVLDEIARTSVTSGDDDGDDLASLARRVEQMARMPVDGGPTTSGMGVRIEPSASAPVPPAEAQHRATVTVLGHHPPRGV